MKIKNTCPKCGKHKIPIPFPNNAHSYAYLVKTENDPFIELGQNKPPPFMEKCMINYDEIPSISVPLNVIRMMEIITFLQSIQPTHFSRLLKGLLENGLMKLAKQDPDVELIEE